MSSPFRRKIGLLVLVAVLLAPWAAVAEPGARNDPGAGAPWDLLARLWGAVTTLWGNNGCSMDPNGECRGGSVLSAPPENVDAGCHMDPYGACKPGS